MLFTTIIIGYCAANVALAAVVLFKSPRNTLSRFFAHFKELATNHLERLILVGSLRSFGSDVH